MSNFEWFLLIIVVIVVPLIVAGAVTLWSIDQANKRKRQNRSDPNIGVKRKAALSPEEADARRAERYRQQDVEEVREAGAPPPPDEPHAEPDTDVSRETSGVTDPSRNG